MFADTARVTNVRIIIIIIINCRKYEKSGVGSKVGELLENLETITERHEEVVERTLSGEMVSYEL